MGKLNTKIKFLIIAVYTLLLFLLVFVLFSPKAIDLYESYGRTPYDDHIGIMIKVTENRPRMRLHPGAFSASPDF